MIDRTIFRLAVLLPMLAVAFAASGCREQKAAPRVSGYTFKVKESHDLTIRGTVTDIAQIGNSGMSLTWADPNSRYTVSVRVDEVSGMDPATCPIKVGQVKHFGIHSVAKVFPDRSILNRSYTFQLTYEVSEKKKKRYRNFSAY